MDKLGISRSFINYIFSPHIASPVIDQHGVGGGAVLGQLPVASTGGDHGQLDGIEGVTGQHLSVEPRVDHCGLKHWICLTELIQ